MPDKMSQGEDRPPARLRRRGRRRADRRRRRTRRESYYRVADRLAEEIPGAFQPNQYFNPANPQAHYALDRARAVGADRRARSRTSSSASAPAARSPAPGATSRSATRDLEVIGADPVGSIYSGGEEVKPVPRRGRRRGLLAGDVRPVGRRPLRDASPTATRSSRRAGWR